MSYPTNPWERPVEAEEPPTPAVPAGPVPVDSAPAVSEPVVEPVPAPDDLPASIADVLSDAPAESVAEVTLEPTVVEAVPAPPAAEPLPPAAEPLPPAAGLDLGAQAAPVAASTEFEVATPAPVVPVVPAAPVSLDLPPVPAPGYPAAASFPPPAAVPPVSEPSAYGYGQSGYPTAGYGQSAPLGTPASYGQSSAYVQPTYGQPLGYGTPGAYGQPGSAYGQPGSAYGQPTPQATPAAYGQPAPQATPAAYGQPTDAPAAGYAQPGGVGYGQQPAQPWSPNPAAPGAAYQQPAFGTQAPYPMQPVPYQQGYAPYGASQLAPADEATWASMAHWLGILIGFVGPLIALLAQGDKSPRVRAAAVESLNFQLTLLIGYVVSFVLTFVVIGVVGFAVLPLLQIIFPIIAALAENKGQSYRYPFAIRMVK